MFADPPGANSHSETHRQHQRKVPVAGVRGCDVDALVQIRPISFYRPSSERLRQSEQRTDDGRQDRSVEDRDRLHAVVSMPSF